MSFFTVDREKCKHDGVCVEECPVGVLSFQDGLPIPSEEDAANRCIKCGHCVAVCPHGAFSLDIMQADACPPVQPDGTPDVERMEYILRARRSIRLYQDREVEQEKVQKLIEIARYSPTGTNSQQIKWLVLSGKEKVQSVAREVIHFFHVLARMRHPLAEKYRLDKITDAFNRGNDIICRGAPALVFAYAPKEYGIAGVDCTSALAYLDLAAPSLGLGTCWGGFIMFALPQSPALQKILDLPEDQACFGAMMLGYPKYRYHRLPLRNAPTILWR